MFLASGGLTGPADINTGLKFVTKGSVGPYLSTKTRYEGSSDKAQIVHAGRSGADQDVSVRARRPAIAAMPRRSCNDRTPTPRLFAAGRKPASWSSRCC